MELDHLPRFTDINTEQIPAQLDALLAAHLQKIEALTQQPVFSWHSLMQPLEDMEDSLERFWAPIAHLHAVCNSPQLRACYEACLPKFTAYHTAIGQNEKLYSALCSISDEQLNPTQRKILDDTRLEFTLSGVALSAEKKKRFEAIETRLSILSNQFETHVLDTEQAYVLSITEEDRLRGIPDHARHHANALATEKNRAGWLFNLEIPCYLAVITYADDRALREEMYTAFITRASDQGPVANQFDNSLVMNELLALRHEKAQLLGFANYAEYSIATKMAESTQSVLQFLSDLRDRSYAQAQKEFAALCRFAKDNYQLTEVKPWDIAYLSEKKQQSLFQISQEMLRSYFPLPKVMAGIFAIANKLYGITFHELSQVNKWHSDVLCYQVTDEQQNKRGILYLDLFARPHKRGGAWMDSLQTRRRLENNTIQFPIATLTCNFAKPIGDKPATLSHDEVLTLFHELGHCLHHVLTQVENFSASGTQGVEWDAVELPSQFFENWCWDKIALNDLSAHEDTGEPLPEAMLDQLFASKNFQSAMAMLRQLEFGLFDFRIHLEYQQDPDVITKVLTDVRKNTSVLPIAPFNRFQHSFTHIFSGGYAAGYYSYFWAEVLSSDAFARFEEEGIFNPSTGRDFLHCILETGGSRKAAESFSCFRGRVPSIEALLRHRGIAPSSSQ